MRFANLISFLAVESRYLVPGMIIIATSKIAVTLDNYSKKWYNMSQGDEKNGQNAAQCGAMRGRKQLLNDEDKQHIRQCIDETPDITLAELRTKLGLKASIQTLSRVVRAMGYRVKKRACRHPNRSAPDVRKERRDWRGSGLEKQANHLVFLDESSVNIDLTRRYGRTIGKTRVHGHAPLSTPRAQTVLGSVRLNGQTTHTTYTGGTTGQRFLEYLKDILIPISDWISHCHNTTPLYTAHAMMDIINKYF